MEITPISRKIEGYRSNGLGARLIVVVRQAASQTARQE